LLPLGNSKVRRFFEIRGKNSSGEFVDVGTNMLFGYGWRRLPNDSLDEQNNLQFEMLKLQNWFASSWVDLQTSAEPQWERHVVGHIVMQQT
jgi:hypothetical protein